MAKKKKQEQRYFMQSFVPESSGKRYVSERTGFYGLDRRERADSGYMSQCCNIDVSRLPEVMSADGAEFYCKIESSYGEICGFHSFQDKLFVVCEDEDEEKIKLLKLELSTFGRAAVTEEVEWKQDDKQVKNGERREMAVFCYYPGSDNLLYCQVKPIYYLLVYPDRMCVPIDEFYKEDSDGNNASQCKLIADESPVFEHITVWNSRLFGVRDNVVACSCAGTFFDWTCDTAQSTDASGLAVGGYDETHAWYSTTQANIQASGSIAAIVAYDGHPIIFKDDYMHQINNNKNPFRIQDIVAVGCVGARSICELDGVLYFAFRDGIYRYGGGYPERISEALNWYSFDKDTVCGAYDGVLYVYNPLLSESLIYTFCPKNGLWACVDNPHGNNSIIAFTANDTGLYSIGDDYEIYAYPARGDSTGSEAEWSFTTDLSIFETAGDKRIHSLKIFAEGQDLRVDVIHHSTSQKIATVINEDDIYGKDNVCVLLRRFDNIWHKLRFSGSGQIRIRHLEVVYSLSGDRYI